MTGNIGLALAPGLDAGVWSSDHARGQVPSAWPYGLDALRIHGNPAVPLTFPALRPHERVTRKLAQGFVWAAAGSVDPSRFGSILSWDERIGLPLALRFGDKLPVHTGAIWLTDQRLTPWTRALVQRSLQRAASVWVSSRSQVDVIAAQWGVDRSRITWVPFGVDPDFWELTEYRGSVHAPVLAVGNDQHRAWGTFKAVTRAMPETPFQVASRSHEAQGLRRANVSVSAMSHRMLRDAYRACAAVVIPVTPNIHVSGVTALLEAMSVGRPVIIPAAPGLDDYVRDGVTGVVLPDRRVSSYVDALRAILRNPADAAEMGRRASHWVRMNRTTVTQARHLALLLERAVQ